MDESLVRILKRIVKTEMCYIEHISVFLYNKVNNLYGVISLNETWVKDINEIIYLLKMIIMGMCTYYGSIKILNIKSYKHFQKLIVFITFVSIAILSRIINRMAEFNINSIIYIIFGASIIFSINTKNKFGYSVLINTISLSINEILFSVASALAFIPYMVIGVKEEYINFLLISVLHIGFLVIIFRIKRVKNGFSFLRKNKENQYMDIFILNIGSIILFSIFILSNYKENITINILVGLFIFSIIMFITIQKSLQLYYKQKMLVKDLEETKVELKEKKKEVEALEKENMEFSKISHSIAHKQKSLEHKLEELSMKNEIANEIEIKDRIEKLGKGLSEKQIVVLGKTEIPEIDDMLSFMQSECVKNKIDFQLQLSGNIYTMINHYISKEELEILLADHIKNAIIAIGYRDNVNKSILVRLGKLDGYYGLYVYDSGIEFEIETLLNLGKKPSTTHKDSGGTGMGFMNTFDTLRNNKASLIIEEYGKPVSDNFTKALKFKFDGKNEFKIYSYREEEIKKVDKENTLVVEKL